MTVKLIDALTEKFGNRCSPNAKWDVYVFPLANFDWIVAMNLCRNTSTPKNLSAFFDELRNHARASTKYLSLMAGPGPARHRLEAAKRR